MRWYEIWRMNDDRPAGNPDYVGSVEARDEDEADTLGRFLYGLGPQERLEIQVDEEQQPGANVSLQKRLPRKVNAK